jgi:hypothetical protein
MFTAILFGKLMITMKEWITLGISCSAKRWLLHAVVSLHGGRLA